MPITRIALSEHCFTQWQDEISIALQDALERHFNVPAGDCFQLFDRYSDGARVYDRHYLSGAEQGRSDDFLLLQITAGKPRNAQQKQAFYSALVDSLGQSIGIKPQDVMIIVSFTEPEDWSFGCGKVFDLADIPGSDATTQS